MLFIFPCYVTLGVVDLPEGDEELEKAREQLYKDIGYVENDENKYPKEVGQDRAGLLG